MRRPQLLDVVAVKDAVHGYGFDNAETAVVVPKGELGTIVHEFHRPDEAYEVEFSNDYGETVAMVTLKPDQFVVVYPLGKRVPVEVRA